MKNYICFFLVVDIREFSPKSYSYVIVEISNFEKIPQNIKIAFFYHNFFKFFVKIIYYS